MAVAANPFDPEWWTTVTLEDSELATIVHRAGFSRTRTHRGVREDAVAVAIILAESGGDPNAHNDNPATGDDSYGLFQINMIGEMGERRARKFGLRSYSNLFEPRDNARAAMIVFREAGNSFSPWSTYKNGTYAAFLPRALKAVKNPSEDIPTLESQLESQFPELAAFGSLVSFFTDEDNWKRVAWFVGGGGLIIVGLIMAVGPSVARATVGRYTKMLGRG